MPERISRRHPGGELHQLSLDHRRGWAGEPIAPLGLALHAETGGRDRVDAAGEREARPGVDLLPFQQSGRATVRTPVTNAHLVCRPLLEKKTHQESPTYSPHTNEH